MSEPAMFDSAVMRSFLFFLVFVASDCLLSTPWRSNVYLPQLSHVEKISVISKEMDHEVEKQPSDKKVARWLERLGLAPRTVSIRRSLEIFHHTLGH